MARSGQSLSFPRCGRPTSASTPNLLPTPVLNGRLWVTSIRSLTKRPVQRYSTVVLGVGGVGKSALIMCFSKGIFIKQYDPTIEDEYSLNVEYEGKRSILQVRDTTGIEQFMGINESSIQESVGFVLVFSLTQKDTLQDLDRIWQQIFQIKEGDQDIPMVIVGTKMDLRWEREVSSETVQALAMEWGVPFYETSAKKGWHANEVFHHLIRRMRTKYPHGQPKSMERRVGQCVIM